jgi:hypothetical protein
MIKMHCCGNQCEIDLYSHMHTIISLKTSHAYQRSLSRAMPHPHTRLRDLLGFGKLLAPSDNRRDLVEYMDGCTVVACICYHSDYWLGLMQQSGGRVDIHR